MKVYVEMTEEEYDFFKAFKNDKNLIIDNLKKLYVDYFRRTSTGKVDARQEVEILYQTLNKYLLTLFEIKE